MKAKKNKSPYYQQDLFYAETKFFLLLAALITDENSKGETRLAEMTPYGLSVYVALRRAADFDSGMVSIGQRELARQCGIRQATIGKYIQHLIDLGYVEKINNDDDNSRGTYRMIDHLNVEHREKPAGKISMPYSPRKVSGMLDDVRSFLKNGQLSPTAKNAGIQVNITLNITNIAHADNVYFGTQEETLRNYRAVLSMPEGAVGKQEALNAIRAELDRWEAADEDGGQGEYRWVNPPADLKHGKS